MDQIIDITLSALLIIGGVFALVGSFGLLKLRDTMQRLHAPTKATTVGVGTVLIVSVAHFWFYRGMVSWHELLITLFLLLTAPITANFIAKAQILRNVRQSDLPVTGVGTPWATFDTNPDAPERDLAQNEAQP